MQRWNSKREMMGDDPPYLAVGTEVSAKYKGAFCEAKVRKVVRSVKCKVAFKLGLGTATVTDDHIRGTLRAGANVEVKHPEKKEFVEGTITKIQDCSQYTVVFDDGDITTLRRTALCLKSGRHFAESETLDQLPLTHPEHFGNPVIGGRRGRRNRDDSSDEEETSRKGKHRREEKEADIGKVVCVEISEKKKQKDNWFPGLVVAPTAQDAVKIHVREEYLVRSFKDGRYYTVPKKEATPFTREIGSKVDNNTLRTAVEKALLFLDKDELPPHWDRELLFGLDESSDSDSDAAFDSDSSDDEPREEKDHFVAQLYKFMDDRGTPINRGPTISSKDVDLYKLFKVVHKLGGYNRVTNHNQWKTISHKLGFGQNAATVNLVKHAYKKFLHSFEDFYRKLGCTMVNHPRGNRARHRSNRSLIRDRDRATPINKEKVNEKETEEAKDSTAAPSQKEDPKKEETSKSSKEEEKPAKESIPEKETPKRESARKETVKNKKDDRMEKKDDKANIQTLVPSKRTADESQGPATKAGRDEKAGKTTSADDREDRIKLRESNKAAAVDSGAGAKSEAKQEQSSKNHHKDINHHKDSPEEKEAPPPPVQSRSSKVNRRDVSKETKAKQEEDRKQEKEEDRSAVKSERDARTERKKNANAVNNNSEPATAEGSGSSVGGGGGPTGGGKEEGAASSKSSVTCSLTSKTSNNKVVSAKTKDVAVVKENNNNTKKRSLFSKVTGANKKGSSQDNSKVPKTPKKPLGLSSVRQKRSFKERMKSIVKKFKFTSSKSNASRKKEKEANSKNPPSLPPPLSPPIPAPSTPTHACSGVPDLPTPPDSSLPPPQLTPPSHLLLPSRAYGDTPPGRDERKRHNTDHGDSNDESQSDIDIDDDGSDEKEEEGAALQDKDKRPGSRTSLDRERERVGDQEQPQAPLLSTLSTLTRPKAQLDSAQLENPNHAKNIQLTRSKSKEEVPVRIKKEMPNLEMKKVSTSPNSSMGPMPIQGNALDNERKRGRKRKDDASSEEVLDQLPSYKSVSVGDKLKVYYGPTHESKVTYEAKVLSTKEEGSETMYLVHYTGWNTRYDEWIKRSRIADNLSWSPGRVKRNRQPQQQSPRLSIANKRGRSSDTGQSSGGSGRATTPSITSPSLGRNKLQNTRTYTRSKQSSRRLAGQTEFSDSDSGDESDSDSDAESNLLNAVQKRSEKSICSGDEKEECEITRSRRRANIPPHNLIIDDKAKEDKRKAAPPSTSEDERDMERCKEEILGKTANERRPLTRVSIEKEMKESIAEDQGMERRSRKLRSDRMNRIVSESEDEKDDVQEKERKELKRTSSDRRKNEEIKSKIQENKKEVIEDEENLQSTIKESTKSSKISVNHEITVKEEGQQQSSHEDPQPSVITKGRNEKKKSDVQKIAEPEILVEKEKHENKSINQEESARSDRLRSRGEKKKSLENKVIPPASTEEVKIYDKLQPLNEVSTTLSKQKVNEITDSAVEIKQETSSKADSAVEIIAECTDYKKKMRNDKRKSSGLDSKLQDDVPSKEESSSSQDGERTRRSRRGLPAKKEEVVKTVIPKEDYEEEQPKGRDFDLVQIRSELKGIEKAVKVPPLEIKIESPIDDEISKDVEGSGNNKVVDVIETKVIKQEEPEMPVTKEVDTSAEDIYEFKEPEPFEFEVRQKCGDEKGGKQRRTFGRICGDDMRKCTSPIRRKIIRSKPERPPSPPDNKKRFRRNIMKKEERTEPIKTDKVQVSEPVCEPSPPIPQPAPQQLEPVIKPTSEPVATAAPKPAALFEEVRNDSRSPDNTTTGLVEQSIKETVPSKLSLPKVEPIKTLIAPIVKPVTEPPQQPPSPPAPPPIPSTQPVLDRLAEPVVPDSVNEDADGDKNDNDEDNDDDDDDSENRLVIFEVEEMEPATKTPETIPVPSSLLPPALQNKKEEEEKDEPEPQKDTLVKGSVLLTSSSPEKDKEITDRAFPEEKKYVDEKNVVKIAEEIKEEKVELKEVEEDEEEELEDDAISAAIQRVIQQSMTDDDDESNDVDLLATSVGKASSSSPLPLAPKASSPQPPLSSAALSLKRRKILSKEFIDSDSDSDTEMQALSKVAAAITSVPISAVTSTIPSVVTTYIPPSLPSSLPPSSKIPLTITRTHLPPRPQLMAISTAPMPALAIVNHPLTVSRPSTLKIPNPIPKPLLVTPSPIPSTISNSPPLITKPQLQLGATSNPVLKSAPSNLPPIPPLLDSISPPFFPLSLTKVPDKDIHHIVLGSKKGDDEPFSATGSTIKTFKKEENELINSSKEIPKEEADEEKTDKIVDDTVATVKVDMEEIETAPKEVEKNPTASRSPEQDLVPPAFETNNVVKDDGMEEEESKTVEKEEEEEEEEDEEEEEEEEEEDEEEEETQSLMVQAASSDKSDVEEEESTGEERAETKGEEECVPSLLCEETIPGSPAPPVLKEKEAEIIDTAELPFASAPGTSLHSTSSTYTKPVLQAPLQPPPVQPPPEAAPVMDNTPPTTPESSLSPISNSPRGERSGSSPGLDNDSSKSHRDSSEIDLDSYTEVNKMDHDSEEDSVCNIGVSGTTLLKKPLNTQLEADSSPSKKRRRSRKRSEDTNKRAKLTRRSPRNPAGSDSDDTSENSLAGSSLDLPSSRSPKPSKYNFYVQLDPELDGAQRIAVLQQKLQELRKTYMSLKNELACIDRRRKKLRRREREGPHIKSSLSEL